MQDREEELLQKAIEEAKATGLPEEEWPKERPLRRLWRNAQAVPASKRRDWRLAEDGQNLDDIHFALMEEQGVSDISQVNRVVKIPIKRPKGVRKQIIAQVAVEIGETQRMVRTCWEEYRRVEKRMNDEEL